MGLQQQQQQELGQGRQRCAPTPNRCGGAQVAGGLIFAQLQPLLHLLLVHSFSRLAGLAGLWMLFEGCAALLVRACSCCVV